MKDIKTKNCWNKIKDKPFFIFVVVYIVLAFLIVFVNLSSNPIREFDEARMGISAYEMLQTHNPIVVNFLGEPDLWNTKPPLVIWIEALSIKIFGLGEFAIRLPSALALFCTGLLLLMFGKKIKQNFFGFIAAVLLCCWEVVFVHCGRTADYDAFLLLFNTAYILCFWLYLNDTQNKKYLLWFFIFLTLGALTKDIASFISLTVLFVYALIKRQVVTIVKEKYFWIGALILIIFFGGFLVLRESMSGGYIKALWQNNIMGRYTQALENTPTSKFYYIGLFMYKTMRYLFVFIPFALVLNIFNKNKELKDLNYYVFSIAVFIFLIVSFSKTKLDWYAYPAVPMLCIVLAIAIDFLKEKIKTISSKRIRVGCYLLLFVIFFALPLRNNIFSDKGSLALSTMHDGSDYPYPAWIKLLKTHKQEILSGKIDNLYFLQTQWPLDSYFYYLMFDDKGLRVYNKYNSDWNNLPKGCYVLTIWNSQSKSVLGKYDFEEMYSLQTSENNSKILRVIGKKQ